MADHLAGLTAVIAKPARYTTLSSRDSEDLQQGVTGLAGQPVGLPVVAAELLLQHAVRVASLLLPGVAAGTRSPWCPRPCWPGG